MVFKTFIVDTIFLNKTVHWPALVLKHFTLNCNTLKPCLSGLMPGPEPLRIKKFPDKSNACKICDTISALFLCYAIFYF